MSHSIGPAGGIADLRDAMRTVTEELSDMEKLARRRQTTINDLKVMLATLVSGVLGVRVPQAQLYEMYEEAVQKLPQMRELWDSVYIEQYSAESQASAM